ncbi:MAG: hypothetical protein J7498_14980 [Sphingobium sp.]|nr:hypothetical protein [Sphingobium sp.]
MKTVTIALASLLAGTAASGQAQTTDHDMADMPGMDHSKMDHGQMDPNMPGMDHSAMPGMDHGGTNRSVISQLTKFYFGPCPRTEAAASTGSGENADECTSFPSFAEGSGTARLPGAEGEMRGLHIPAGDWMVMAHGYVTGTYTDHKGPRGDDLFYSTSMLMLSGERETGWGRVQLRSMMSLEPTLSARGYPNLFATGETAGGVPLVDRQHPHDLFMELSARVDVNIGEKASLFLYGGPIGEPALGPSAFMHRGSAKNNPEPPISHHWFDSTHITYGVVTTGLSTPHWQIEGSVFRGAEPDENRWDIETPRLDSWSARLSWNPTPNWSAQLSHGFIKAPESSHVGENEYRTTASISYADGPLSATAAFSAKDRSPGPTLTAWLVEANYDLSRHHSLFVRFENVDNDELVPDHSDPLHDRPFRISKFQAGYAWHTGLGDGPFALTLGGSANLYGKPAALDRIYGRNPWGYTVFAKLSLGH